MSTVATAHIEIDENGVAWIDDTQVKVIEVVIDKIVHGSSPEEMHLQYRHLSLAQIHAALAYYYDNQTALDDEIERRWKEADELAQTISDSSLRQKLLTTKEARRKSKTSSVTYRSGKGRDTWHWCASCSTWPMDDYEESPFKPTAGELCNECKERQSAGTCCQ
jgi:uncharacterized protein (DUF433 family)